MKNYQVFISYRRDGGDALAGRLADRLKMLGYNVFYDVETMRSGPFNTQILEAIAQCNDFLLVLPPNALDRCINKDDWVRQELAFAIRNNKKIIPVMMRGFEFPSSLPEDIDKVRFMEGVEASQAYFDSVIDRIDRLLESKPAEQKSNSAFPIYEDPDFSEDVIEDIIYYHLLGNPIPESLKRKVDTSIEKFYTLQYPEEYTGLPGRSILMKVQCENKKYDIYDIFYKNKQKYAYGLESDINPASQQIGVFFSIDENDNIEPVLTGTPNGAIPSVDVANLFSWYTKFRRGLGGVPDVLYPLLENQLKSISTGTIGEFSDFLGLTNEDMSNISELRKNDFSMLSSTNRNLLYTRIKGIYKGLGVYVSDGNCYGNRFQGFFAGRIIRTPIRKKIILDIVPTKIKGTYIALTYPKIRKKKRDYLVEGPEYYLITKDADGILDFCKISDENLSFYCKGYFERFALIYMQVKLQIMNLFLKG